MNPHPCQEPEIVYPEEQFEIALDGIIRTGLSGDVPITMVRRFGLDLAVFVHQSGASRVVFIEAKSYGGQRQGGVGFGNSVGQGPQVEILLSSVDQLAILDNHMRWAFADATQPPGAARYALLTCSQARGTAMGGVAKGKQNNFRISSLKAHSLTWPIFCENLLAFLSGTNIDRGSA
jgi:hypothetical protein